VDEFLIESDSPEDFVIVHAVEGHRFHFHVASHNGRRVLSPAGSILQNNAADHNADYFENAALRIAMREALALGLIDPEQPAWHPSGQRQDKE
jgi:hypothetical protein